MTGSGVAQGWCCVPAAVLGTAGTGAGGVVRVQRGLGGSGGVLFAPQGWRWYWELAGG